MMRRAASGSRAGLTLLEIMITVSIMGLVMTAAMGTIGSSTASSVGVTSSALENADLRASGKVLTAELRSSGGGRFEVTELADGNNELTFQVPVMNGVVASWGAYDRRLGGLEANWNQEDWSLRYTVVPGPNGTRQLVRQVLDAVDVVQRQTVLAEDLRSGAGDPKGFSVEDMGDVWEIVITTMHARAIGGDSGGTKIHVRTQN